GAMLAAVARPVGDGPFPLIVILHGSHGFGQQYLQLASDLAAGGFVAVAGCWFAGQAAAAQSPLIDCPQAPPRPSVGNQDTVRSAAILVNAARTLPGVQSDRFGLFGHSIGGSTAILYSSRASGVQALVADSAGYFDGLNSLAGQLQPPFLLLHGAL